MDIYVYVDAANLEGSPLYMGKLLAESVRGREVFCFEASKDWAHSGCFPYLDADLRMYEGSQYAPAGKDNFGLFLDSCPDRWGRVLMQRRARLRARESGEGVPRLRESDYLLGVYDGNRMGALRFSLSPGGPFLDNDASLATPPLTSLRALEQASLGYESEEERRSPEYRRWLEMLYNPGSSLGGARPKANVVDAEGNLWIAKFPSRHDTFDVGAWEYLVTCMARDFGLNVPAVRLGKYTSRHHTYMTRRFDRIPGGRLHFASAMTLLGYRDGDSAAEGVSYLELSEFVQRYGASPQEDMEELWRRVAFNIAVSNCDDHLCNHGFVLGKRGWRLSPAYDLTPCPDGVGLKLNVDETDNALDFGLALSTAPYYGVDDSTAREALSRLRQIVGTWRDRAAALGISRASQEEMEPAFRLPSAPGV